MIKNPIQKFFAVFGAGCNVKVHHQPITKSGGFLIYCQINILPVKALKRSADRRLQKTFVTNAMASPGGFDQLFMQQDDLFFG